ncbi:type II toxin-antitoxin system MqsR family toxin [Methylobacterium sp. WL69]|uniref:type II toxin-antitoxin system MqsR family toxin n=1 Tax=Methylobacterium sp. WL69 TaxID=2603893 RepID=UPI0011CC24F1|nr:type II toxin-antitoxin system MqsR family toxin [Methylobacterium sp. WL69]TXM69561.1 type II toxin-antitoxin system MqsR family toxin [Methylobacterium sp. WL69]
MSEKRKPTYDLHAFRAWARSPKFSAAGSAVRTAAALGVGSNDMVRIVQMLERKHFQKSVTSHANPREWQDVYHVPSSIGVLYIKFRADVVTEFLLLSFKEKNND